MSKFELTPEQQDQFDREGTMTIKDDKKPEKASQEELTENREKMVKGLEAMGKSGYVYKDPSGGGGYGAMKGEINGVKFKIDSDGGFIFTNNTAMRMENNVRKAVYEKYKPIAIDKIHEGAGIITGNEDIKEHDIKIQRKKLDEFIKELL